MSAILEVNQATLDRLKDMLKKNKGLDADDLIKVVNEDLLDFLEGIPVGDVLTVKVIEKTGDS